MSIYEMINYDAMLERAGIPYGEITNDDGTITDREWFCGANQQDNVSYDEAGITYDDIVNYNGRSAHGPGGLCLSGDINVNGLLLNNRDLNGTLWLCTGIDGWWTLPPSEIPDIPRPYWDGSMLTTGRYLSRIVTVSGCFIPPGPEWVWYNRDAILRCSGIVRGIGLLAVCGNKSPTNQETVMVTTLDEEGEEVHTFYPNDFYDPPKMAVIQTADVPLVDTVRPNGFTQFSLSFRCSFPTKASVKENHQPIPIPAGEGAIGRAYRSFSQTEYPGLAYDDPANEDTSYIELTQIETESEVRRNYADVRYFNPDALIPDENEIYSSSGEADPNALIYHNGGNYFTFPTIVFQATTGIDATSLTDKTLIISNLTTGERMVIVKNIPNGNWLVVDNFARRVALVTPAQKDKPGTWQWNARNFLGMQSEWISLAAGDNQFGIQKGEGVSIGSLQPVMYWRDTWIG